MGEEPWFTLNDRIEPGPSPRWLALETLELVHRPPNEVGIDAPHQEVQLGAVEGPESRGPRSSRRVLPSRLGRAHYAPHIDGRSMADPLFCRIVHIL